MLELTLTPSRQDDKYLFFIKNDKNKYLKFFIKISSGRPKLKSAQSSKDREQQSFFQ